MEPILPQEPVTEAVPRARSGKLLWLVPVVVVALALSFVRLPYFVFTPGPTENVLDQIRIDGAATFAPRGRLLLTTVVFYEANLYQIVDAWLDPAEAVVPRDQVLSPGQTLDQNISEQQEVFKSSRIDATIVAFSGYGGYPERRGAGLLVESVGAGLPAAGKLAPGEVIVAIDGAMVVDADRAGRLIQAAGAGTPLRLSVQGTDGVWRSVSVAPANVKGYDHPIIGVSLVPNFPARVSFEGSDIGGPSAGLMWTLGLVDLLTRGDLTGGRTISGTGTISPDGKVGAIGGVEEKIAGAERAGATLFFVPLENAGAARAAAGDILVVPVSTYREAVRYLETHP